MTRRLATSGALPIDKGETFAMLHDMTSSIEAVAFHEAGHAVVGAALGRPPNRSYVRDDLSGLTTFVDDRDVDPADKSAATKGFLEKVLVTLVAGLRAEYSATRESSTVVDGDMARIRTVLNLLGVSDNPASRDPVLDVAREEADRLLRTHWPWVEAVAAALVTDRSLDGDRINSLREV